MPKLIIARTVRELAKEKGKKVSPGFIEYLEFRVKRIINGQCHRLGSRKTLNRADALAVDGG